MSHIRVFTLLSLSILALNQNLLFGQQVGVPFSVDEISQYLFIGTGDDDSGDSINLQKTEFGANQMFLSSSDPNLADVFDGRWSSVTNSTIGNIPRAAPVFEGIDFSGNMAITSNSGRFTMSDSEVYANAFSVRCASSSGVCQENDTNNSTWFTPSVPPSGGSPINSGKIDNGAGVEASYDHSGLVGELISAHTFITDLSAEYSITTNLEYGSSSLNIDALDTNNDGIAVIDINVGDNDWLLNDYDLILDGDGDTFAIFRVRGDTNMLMSNSSIALGTGGIGNGSEDDPASQLSALFVQYEEPEGNTDSVFSFSNFILNGVGIWDLNAFRDGMYDDTWDTEVNLQNGQGCSQFISSSVTHTSSGRWIHCGIGVAIPEPNTLVLLVLATAPFCFRRNKK